MARTILFGVIGAGVSVGLVLNSLNNLTWSAMLTTKVGFAADTSALACGGWVIMMIGAVIAALSYLMMNLSAQTIRALPVIIGPSLLPALAATG